MHIIGGGKQTIIGQKIKPKCIVHYEGNKVDRFEDFIVVGFNNESAKLHTPTDLPNIAIAIEILTKLLKEEYMQLPKDTQEMFDKFLESRGVSTDEQDRSKNT